MKVCDLTQFYSPVSGGVKRYLHEKKAFIERLRPNDSHVLIVPSESDGVERAGQCVVYRIKSPLVSRTSRYRLLLRLGAVETILARELPDVIESGDPYQLAWKAVASARALRTAAVAFYHSHFAEAYVRSVMKFFGETATEFMVDLARRYTRTLYNRFDRTIVPSAPLKEVLASWGIDRLCTIDLGVDVELFKPDPEKGALVRREFGFNKNSVCLLYVGRLAPEKNLGCLISAFRLLHKAEPDRFRLVIIGDGPLRNEVLSLKEETKSVIWLPFLDDAKRLPGIYCAADLFVHPGLQETFGLVTIESQACGTPVVGIRGSYMDRLIYSGITCWADRNDAPSLAEAINKMLSIDLKQVALKSSAHVRERYSWNRIFSRLFGIYEEVISERGA